MNTILTPKSLSEQTAAARAAQSQWANLTVPQRLQPVERFRRLIVAHCDRLCSVIGEEVGKPAAAVISGEILPTADACVFLRKNAASTLRPRSVTKHSPMWMTGSTHVIHRRPRGVVGIIGTWNYPLFLNGGQILEALVAGNAVVWKPSEVAPKFASLLTELLDQCGFPNGLIQTLPATREMGPMLANADIDHVVFTGSMEVGRKLAARLGERLVSSTLELSGCDVQLILADADVALAAKSAYFGVALNHGQTCIAVRRVFVHRSLYDNFLERLRPLFAAAPAMQLALPSQVRQCERLVAEALAEGANLLVERDVSAGERECHPVALIDAKPEMSVCHQAAFAPVLAVIPFDSVEEALAGESKCPYALAGSVFTRDIALGQRIAAGLRSGHISINEVIVPTAHPATPFGGRGESGWGVTKGAEGLLEMTVPQAVSVVTTRFRPYYDLVDPSKHESQEQLLRALMEANHGAGLFTRLGAWWRVLRQMWRGV